MKCPHCRRNIDDATIARHLARKGGGANTRAQKAWRRQAKPGAGRPRVNTPDHVHRALAARSRTVAWTSCVMVGPCTGRAHGGTTRIDECRCGAIRLTESNGTARRVGRWSME